MAKNLFVYPCDSYAGKAVADAFSAAGYSVSGFATGNGHVPSSVATHLKASDEGSGAGLKQLLLTADLVVYDLLGNEHATREAVVQLAQEPYGGREVTFVAISSPLVWAVTRPNPEALFASLSAGDGLGADPDGSEGGRGWPYDQGASGGQEGGAAEDQAGEGDAAAPESPQQPPVTAPVFTADDVARRAPAASARLAMSVEQTVLRSGRRGRLRTYVVCPGLLYGAGEDDNTLFQAAKAAWSWQAPLVYGKGSNILPTLHVADLAAYLLALGQVAGAQVAAPPAATTILPAGTAALPTGTGALGLRPETTRPEITTAGTGALATGPLPVLAAMWSNYLLVSDGGRCTQADVVTALSRQLGDGRVEYVPDHQLHAHPRALRERLLLDLSFETTPLPYAAPFAATHRPGTSTGALPPATAGAAGRPTGTANGAVATSPPGTANSGAGALLLPSFAPSRPGGLPAHVAAVAEEFRVSRRLTPLRLLVLGPPMSGKSHLARRLAHQYRLPYISVPLLLAAAADPAVAAGAGLARIDPALHAQAQAELSAGATKDNPAGTGRVSARTLGVLLAAAVAEPRVAARGFVLDGFPRNLAQARAAFCTLVPAEGVAAAAAQQEHAQAKPAPGAKPAAAGKGAAPPPGAGPSAGDTFEVPPGMRLQPNPLTLPSHVLELAVEEGELHARLAAVEAEELRVALAARLAAGDLGNEADKPKAKKAPAKGKGAAADDGHGLPPQLRCSHNNEHGFARRLAAYNAWRAEDAEDLQARRATAQAAWEEQRAAAEQERARQEAEANTLKAKRRKARLEKSAGGGAPGVAAAETGGLLDDLADWPAEGAGEGQAGDAPAGPKLPEHGGLVGLCVDGGAVHLQVANHSMPAPTEDGAAPPSEATEGGGARHLAQLPSVWPAGIAAAASDAPASGVAVANAVAALEAGPPPPLPGLEQDVEAFLGGPHNFDGFPAPTHQPLHADAEEAAVEAAAEASRAADSAFAEERLAAAQAACAAGEAESQALRLAGQSVAVRRYLMQRVMPVVAAALGELAASRQPKPLLAVAQALYAAAEAEEAGFTDPYTHPSYGVQLAKIEAKAAREAARAAAAAAKAEREAAARQQQAGAEQAAA